MTATGVANQAAPLPYWLQGSPGSNAELFLIFAGQPIRHSAAAAPGVAGFGITKLNGARFLGGSFFGGLQIVHGNPVFRHHFPDALNRRTQFIFPLRCRLPLQVFDFCLNFFIRSHIIHPEVLVEKRHITLATEAYIS
jgi:hypothetical protein